MDPTSINTNNINTNEDECKQIFTSSKIKHKTKQKTTPKQKMKVADSDFKILQMHEYAQINNYQYKICQLKEMCRFYKLKKTGNKDELNIRLFSFLRLSLYATVVQRIWRGYLVKEYVKCIGPSLKDRSICVNDTDFATLEPLNEIKYNQYYSFTGNNNCYGCDVYSLHNLINKPNTVYSGNANQEVRNPYDREIITTTQINAFNRYLRIARALKIHVKIKDDDTEIINPKKRMEMRILELFQYINELGNYADSNWFTNLPRHMLVLFIREMYDIWHYRAQLSQQTMRDIVQPHGNPFTGMSLHLAQSQSDDFLKNTALRIIDFLVKSGHTNEFRALGAYYVLAALTLVSEDARNALPWLYQSVAH
jgi:hypothetical protein